MSETDADAPNHSDAPEISQAAAAACERGSPRQAELLQMVAELRHDDRRRRHERTALSRDGESPACFERGVRWFMPDRASAVLAPCGQEARNPPQSVGLPLLPFDC
jgi:hypothetical protein